MSYFVQGGLVALGAAVGANIRYWIGVLSYASRQPWPWPTLLINLLGSMILGAFAAAAFDRGWADGWKLLIGVGFCGGFTTFSTFSFETVDMILQKQYGYAGSYMAASLVLCVGGCFLGGHFAAIAFRR